MPKICSYHSNLYFPEFKSHVQEMKDKGFDTVLFCIKEEDVLYNLVIFKEFREYGESEGMQTMATFWGYWAGESVISDMVGMDEWVEKVVEAGFKDIMFDEPTRQDLTWFCSEYKEEYPYINFHLCLSDDMFNKLTDEEIKNMPVKSLGVSCYMLGHDNDKRHYRRTYDIAKRLSQLRPNDNFVFIQGFGIPRDLEDLPTETKKVCEVHGITNFAFWAFRADCATGTKRPANPDLIWSKIKF